jgi:tetratricopeptide (TPR) repeat protein
MSSAPAGLQSLPHAIFLQRAARAPQGKGLESRLGQGAFLVLRLIDLLDPGSDDAVHPDAFAYQRVATERFCRDLRASSTEGAHLDGLVGSAAAAHSEGDVRLLAPALLAYAHYLENDLRLDEALDVLRTLRRVGDDRICPADVVAVALRVGRVNRKLNRFDDAEAAYGEAGAAALASGDRHAELLSRIGSAECTRGRGNLPLAETTFRAILRDARVARDRDAEARVEQGMGALLYRMGQPAEALPHTWRAFELYDDEDAQLRALNDLGIMLLMLGDPMGAERALAQVAARGTTQDNVSNALIELMHCASYRRDRVSFARWRRRCEERLAEMPPNILADYYLKLGIGEARFGQFARARGTMDRALRVAEQAGIHEAVFRIERIRNGLRALEEAEAGASQEDAEPVVQSEAVREVSASLARLAAEPA